MADATIGSLPALSELNDDSLLVAEQNGSAQKLSGAQVKSFARAAAASEAEKAAQAASDANSAKSAAQSAQTAAENSKKSASTAATSAASARDAILNMIVSAITLEHGQPATVSKSVVDKVFKLTFGLPRGEKGEAGSPGRGITSITLKSGTHAAGTTDTYTITFTDNTTYDFQVTNGANGFSPTITISKSGKVTTVTVVDANGTQSFEINDGADGLGSGDMHTSTYDKQGKAQDIFAYADAQAGAAMDAATAAASTAEAAEKYARSAVLTASNKLSPTGNGSNVTAAFTQESSRTNIATGEKLSVLFGKIAKWLADLGSLAFKSSVAKSDLASDVQTSLDKADTAMQSYRETDPTVPSWAKAEKKPTYTASEVGAVPTSRKVNGKALSADITLGAVYTATLTAAGWVTSGAWKTQTVSVTGLKASYNAAPFVDVALSGTDAAADVELSKAWLGISASAIADTAADSLTVKFPATVDTPTVNIPIRVTTYD
nr:MAG TPA: hypothetical protein [Bacteriophage sp.]